jgi:two-component system chemotaxis response regulator CheY
MKRILIVDDSPTLLISMEGILSRAGHTVMKASSGQAALDLLRGGEKPNLVITDLCMAGMNGIELIRELRKVAALRFVPILMLTTESSQDRRAEAKAKAAGATGWIVKPVQAEPLREVIKQVVPGA